MRVRRHSMYVRTCNLVDRIVMGDYQIRFNFRGFADQRKFHPAKIETSLATSLHCKTIASQKYKTWRKFPRAT